MEATIHLRFDEQLDTLAPDDAANGLDDLLVGNPFGAGATTAAPVVDGVAGFARSFGGAATTHGFQARDLVPGTTLHNRDVTVQAILTWDAALATLANPGCIICRGNGATAAEYIAYALEVRLVNAAAGIGELRWLWMDAAGVLKTQMGGQFRASSEFLLLTATRRWVSTTELVLRYYLGDRMLAEVPSIDGSIGGGTTGITSVGTRLVSGSWSRWYGGKIDELRVVPRELTPEEIAGTWNRITVHQPRGYELVKELHDPGFPMSADPGSRVQRETRLWGHALGYATAQAENMRDNILPGRAYGEVLEAWEQATAKSPKPGDSVDTRRARVVGRMRQHAGVSIDGVNTAIEELVDTEVDNLELLAFDQTVVETFATLNTLRWWYENPAPFSISGGALRVQNAGVNARFTGTTFQEWYTARMSVGGKQSRGQIILAKITPTATGNGSETGIAFGDFAQGNLILFSYVKPAAGGNMEFRTEVFSSWVSQGQLTHGNIASATVWLMLKAQDPSGLIYDASQTDTKYTIAWSTVGPSGPFTTVTDLVAPWTTSQWAILFHRTIPGSTPTLDFSFDDVKVRAPYGDRSFRWYVYRNPALAGRPDIEGARAALRELGQAHTRGTLTTTKTATYDAADTGYDLTPMGAI